MNLDVDFTLNAVKLMIIAGRTMGMMTAIPIYGTNSVPVKIRVMLSLALTVLYYPLVPDAWIPNISSSMQSLIGLLMLMISEFLIGILFALCFRILQETFSLAGQLIDNFMGFAMARMVDPTLEQQVSMTGAMLNRGFVMVLIISGAHLAIFLLLRDSFSLKPGFFVVNEDVGSLIFELSSLMYRTATHLAMPIMSVIFFINVALGLMTKFGEEFQVLMISFPIRIGAGLIFVAMTLPYIINHAGKLITQLVEALHKLVTPI